MIRRLPIAVALAALFLLSMALLACDQGAAGQREAFEPEMYEAWDSPAMEARSARGLKNSIPPMAFRAHGFDDGLAVSPDGQRLASATPLRPVNTLDVVDVARHTGWRLAHPHPRVGLIEPAFSPDGERLAFVVGLPSPASEFTGVSAIWIVDREGRPLQVIATPGRLYRHPVFSPDGRRLAYARDVFKHLGPHRPLPPENQSAKPMSLFETDLATGTERRLSDERYSSLRPVAYAAGGEALYFGYVGRLVPIMPGSDYLIDDLDTGQAPASGPVPLALFRLDLGDRSIRNVGPSLRPIPGRGPGSAVGMTRDGAVLLLDGALEGRDRLAWSLYLVDPTQARKVAGGAEGQYVQEAAAAPGGAYAAVLSSAVAAPPGLGVHGFLFGRADGRTAPQRLAWGDIAVRPEPVMLDAARPPAGR